MSVTTTIPTLDAPWLTRLEEFKVADFAAFHLLLQAPWSNDSAALDEDDALQLVARAMPEDKVIEQKRQRLSQLLHDSPEAAELWDDVNCDLQNHCEQYALLLGIALGMRLGPRAWEPPAAPKGRA
jgi:hypothetical protein